jgi:hypothetical protein
MSSQSFNYKSNVNLTESLIEVSKTLENIKGQRFSLEKEIENEEIYKEKLIEKLKNFQNESTRINGKRNRFKKIKLVYKKKLHCLMFIIKS